MEISVERRGEVEALNEDLQCEKNTEHTSTNTNIGFTPLKGHSLGASINFPPCFKDEAGHEGFSSRDHDTRSSSI